MINNYLDKSYVIDDANFIVSPKSYEKWNKDYYVSVFLKKDLVNLNIIIIFEYWFTSIVDIDNSKDVKIISLGSYFYKSKHLYLAFHIIPLVCNDLNSYVKVREGFCDIVKSDKFKYFDSNFDDTLNLIRNLGSESYLKNLDIKYEKFRLEEKNNIKFLNINTKVTGDLKLNYINKFKTLCEENFNKFKDVEEEHILTHIFLKEFDFFKD